MVLHFRKPDDNHLERTIRFVGNHMTNLVACIGRDGLVEEATAWEIVIEGFLDALATRLLDGDDPQADACVIGDTLELRVQHRMAEQAQLRERVS